MGHRVHIPVPAITQYAYQHTGVVAGVKEPLDEAIRTTTKQRRPPYSLQQCTTCACAKQLTRHSYCETNTTSNQPRMRHNYPSPPRAARLVLRGISKRYPSVVANDRIDLTIRTGEIHALLGENGAGKSTLMKMVYGVTKPDSGEILWEGREVCIQSPAKARMLGIGMVFQHFALFETLTVAENIVLALDEPESLQVLSQRIREVSQHYGLTIDPERRVHSMSVGERQRVEIVRCLLQKPKLLIMDEPTSVLTPQAVLKLFETLRRLAAEGCSILYISHKLDEIRALCDEATVLRNGQVTGYAKPKQATSSELARLMIGTELPQCAIQPQATGEVMLSVNGLSSVSNDPFGTHLQHIDLRVRRGEIVGIAGISGNGQKELLNAISGEHMQDMAHTLSLCGQDVGRSIPTRGASSD